MNIIEDLIKERHSVRQYKEKAIEETKKEELNTLIDGINKQTGLSIQIFYEEPTCFDSMMAHYGKFSGVRNYISLVGKKDKKDLEVLLGYYGEEIVLKAQELGLNTCFVAMTHGKSKAVINKDEKEVCLISLGYGVTNGIVHKNKPVEKVSNYTKEKPDWFLEGIEAALLAPTAMNQQKFFFEINDKEEVCLKVNGLGFYTKLDLGIVQYHFEAVTRRKVTLKL